MSLVELAADRFPHDLLDALGPAAEGRQWWVLHTRPRQEKAVARDLLAKQAAFYLPLVTRPLRVRGRALASQLPLFTGYVFLLAAAEERAAVLPPRRIASTIRVPDQAEFWADLRQIGRLIAAGEPLTPEDRLAPGDPVEIQSGPLAGVRGTILRAASGDRFVVQVNFIQRGASVLLDKVSLRPAV